MDRARPGNRREEHLVGGGGAVGSRSVEVQAVLGDEVAQLIAAADDVVGAVVLDECRPDSENRALDAFAAGQTFAEVCELLCATLPADEVPALMAGYLHQWVSEGLVTP